MKQNKYRELMDIAINIQRYGSIERHMSAEQRAEHFNKVRVSPFAEALKTPIPLTWEQLNTPYY